MKHRSRPRVVDNMIVPANRQIYDLRYDIPNWNVNMTPHSVQVLYVLRSLVEQGGTVEGWYRAPMAGRKAQRLNIYRVTLPGNPDWKFAQGSRLQLTTDTAQTVMKTNTQWMFLHGEVLIPERRDHLTIIRNLLQHGVRWVGYTVRVWRGTRTRPCYLLEPTNEQAKNFCSGNPALEPVRSEP
jgi:hypothetical protein